MNGATQDSSGKVVHTTENGCRSPLSSTYITPLLSILSGGILVSMLRIDYEYNSEWLRLCTVAREEVKERGSFM